MTPVASGAGEGDPLLGGVRANNLRDGEAFEFETAGNVAGSIQVGDSAATPFTTNVGTSSGRGPLARAANWIIGSGDGRASRAP